MRAHEILETESQIPSTTLSMMEKLRKGASASLTAARLAEIFDFIPGWALQKSKFMKPSDGGWLIKEIPGAQYKGYERLNDGRIHFKKGVLQVEHCNEWYLKDHRAEDAAKVENLENVIFPKLVQLSNTKGKINIVNPTINKYVDERHVDMVDVSFEFIVQCSGFLITSPDGQTYEVYGDYKNGALDPHTFDMFFKWAVENTNLMESILEILGMEPHEKKVDYGTVRYVPPRTASVEEKRVYDLLVEMTNDIRASQKEKYISWLTETVDAYEEAVISGDEKRMKIIREQSQILIQNTFNIRAATTREKNWKEEVEKLAEQSVTYMQNMFVYKNTQKLSPILTAKGNMNDPTIIHLDANSGMIMGSVKFTFEDGSSFIVDNSIVQSSMPNRWGKYTYFYRFPTTFRSVVMPSGEKMSQPSEERVNEIFAKA